MKYLHIDPDDASWFGRWLRGNACGAVVVLGLMWALAQDRSPSGDPIAMAADQAARGWSAVIERTPTGWRRTANGWEHTSSWEAAPRPIGDWITDQESREPRWAQRVLAELRELPPLVFALCQITAITAVVVLIPRSNCVLKTDR